jgi:APA family basic amino acid/polyamine antiporter
MTEPVDRGHADQDNPVGSDGDRPAQQGGSLGLPQATSLVLGTIIGVGVFTLPSSLASYGPISLVALLLTTVGAVALALMFASLSRRMPADGGPYAYARVAFGNLVGFSNAWLYWITTWGGNAAIATGWVLYVETFINKGQATWATIALTLAGIWAATAINLRGVRSMGTIQLWTSILKFIPLLFIATVGLFYIDTANFAVWNLSGQGLWQAIGGAMALCLFSYIGVESASVAAAKVRDPQRNVPRATILGTLMAAGVYLLSRVAIFGIIPNAELQQTTAPFATAAESMFGVAWAGSLMALVVVISGFGALNGWTMLAGEMPFAAASDGLFPEHFGRVSRRGVPAFGIVVSAILATAAVLLSHLGAAGITVFNTLVLMTGITGAIPYAFSALAQIKWRIADGRAITRGRMVRDVGIAAVALVFSVLFIVYSTNGDAEGLARYQPFLFALGAYLIGLPVYWYNRGRMTPPGPVPPPVEVHAS